MASHVHHCYTKRLTSGLLPPPYTSLAAQSRIEWQGPNHSEAQQRRRFVPGVQRQKQRCCFARAVSTQDHHVGSLDASSLTIAVVAGRFNDLVTKLLLDGALDAFHRHGGAKSEVVWVPGSFELPLVAKAMAKSGKFDAVLTIGAVVRGATTHYESVANTATGGTLSAGLESGVPVIFGVLTTENMEQALDRAGGKAGNKGFECAVTAIEVANLMKSLRQEGLAAEPWGLS